MICKERHGIAMVFDEITNYDFTLLRKQGRSQLIYSTELTTEHVFENFEHVFEKGNCPVALHLIARSANKTCQNSLETGAANVWDLVQSDQ